jgi:hypothetical protein
VESSKTSTPLSPSIAGPIPGVNITAPTTIQPAIGAKVPNDQQPLTLVVGNASTSGVRPLTYVFEVAADAGFSTSCFRVRAFRPARVVKRACVSPMRWPPITRISGARAPRTVPTRVRTLRLSHSMSTLRSCSRLRALSPPSTTSRSTHSARGSPSLTRSEMGLGVSSAIWLSWPILTRLPTRFR